MLKVINAAEVRELLPMDECIDLMAQAMRSASAGEVRVPPRLLMSLIDENGSFGLMPGSEGLLGVAPGESSIHVVLKPRTSLAVCNDGQQDIALRVEERDFDSIGEVGPERDRVADREPQALRLGRLDTRTTDLLNQ